MFLSTIYPFPWIKYSFHNTGTIISLTLMRLLSIDIRLLIFCFHELLVMDPDPRDIMPPVCTRKLLCVANYASTHHFITERLSALRVNLIPNAPIDVFHHSLHLTTIILVWSLYYHGEKIQRCWKILMYSPTSKQKLYHSMMELCRFFQAGVFRLSHLEP